MRCLASTLCFSTLIWAVLAADPAIKPKTEETIYDHIHKKADLPTGGDFIAHPKKATVQYYYTNKLLMWNDVTNAKKQSGLYISEDSGATWKLVCYIFEFKRLFIHPDTGTLFASINDTWLVSNKEGYLCSYSSDKAIMSEDGKRWKDISSDKGHVGDIDGFMVDPDNQGRVCLQVTMIRQCIMQSEDANYSKWTLYKAWNWPKRKEIKKLQSGAPQDKEDSKKQE